MSTNSGQEKPPREPQWVLDVLRFWFDELGPEVWFVKNAAVDAKVTEQFLALYKTLCAEIENLRALGPNQALATIIVLDQFPRNMFRDTPQAFAMDDVALRLAKSAIANGLDRDLSARQRQFLYMPFQHSEDAEDQKRSVELYESLGLESALDFAQRHKLVIDQFGRFPHRNSILGRRSTPDEETYLATPGSGF